MRRKNMSNLEYRRVNDAYVIRDQESKVAYAYSGGYDAVVKNRTRIFREELDKFDIPEEEKDEIIKLSYNVIHDHSDDSNDKFDMYVKFWRESLKKELERGKEKDDLKLSYLNSLSKESEIVSKLMGRIARRSLGLDERLEREWELLSRELYKQRLKTENLLALLNLRESIKKAKEAGEPIDSYLEWSKPSLRNVLYQIINLCKAECFFY